MSLHSSCWAQDSFSSEAAAPAKPEAENSEQSEKSQSNQQRASGSAAQHVNQGNRLMAAKQYQAAMAEYNAAKAIDPANPIIKRNIAECFNNMGIMLFRKHMYGDAIGRFEQCLKIMPQHQNARRNIMLCQQRMEIEGIYDPPPEPDNGMENPAESKKEEPAFKAANDNADTGKIISDGGGAVTVSAGGKMYISGSQLFPNYSKQSNAVTTKIAATVPQPPAQQNPAQPVSAENSRKQAAAAEPPAQSKTDQSASPLPNAASWPPSGQAFSPSNSAASTATTNSTASAPEAPSNQAAPVNTDTATAAAASNAVANSASRTAAPSPTQASEATGSANGLSLEQKIEALELKLYGKKNSQLPLMKRIEELEMEHFGETKSGTSFDRVENLRKAIVQN